MIDLKEILKFSPLPITCKENSNNINAGFFININKFCDRKKDTSSCKEYYRKLFSDNKHINEPQQCPEGFSSLVFKINDMLFAFTCFINFPRLGGTKERDLAKRFPEIRFPQEKLLDTIASLKNCSDFLGNLENTITKKYSVAFHEMRKLNRSIKQTSERLHEFTDDNVKIGSIKNDLHKIWKSSDILSSQFDVIEVLANQQLSTLPLKSKIRLFPLFYKIQKIYDTENRIAINQFPDENPQQNQITVCDKTFSIIPTVLIQNALHYSKEGTKVDITLEIILDGSKKQWFIKVFNVCAENIILDDSIFERGKRCTLTAKEGSGNGLYVAQLVAKQHNSVIKLSSFKNAIDEACCLFSLKLEIR